MNTATYELYRNSALGQALIETLDVYVQEGMLSPQLAMRCLLQFDKSFAQGLKDQVQNKISFKVRILP